MYEQQDILGQVMIAFGQGSDSLRVSRASSRALRRFFEPMASPATLEQWDEVGVQALERVRAIGRLAADYAIREARTVITPENVIRAAQEVTAVSRTSICDPDGQPLTWLKEGSELTVQS